MSDILVGWADLLRKGTALSDDEKKEIIKEAKSFGIINPRIRWNREGYLELTDDKGFELIGF